MKYCYLVLALAYAATLVSHLIRPHGGLLHVAVFAAGTGYCVHRFRAEAPDA